jgi:hypothetical protein
LVLGSRGPLRCAHSGFEGFIIGLIGDRLPRARSGHQATDLDLYVASIAREAHTIARPAKLSSRPAPDLDLRLAATAREGEDAAGDLVALCLRENALLLGEKTLRLRATNARAAATRRACFHAFLSGSMIVRSFTMAAGVVTLW